jgi:ATP-dependent DNA helicase PIF1
LDEGQDILIKEALKKCQAPTVLTLKIGADVMLVKNLDIDRKLVNGSRGKVVDIKPYEPPVVDSVFAGPVVSSGVDVISADPAATPVSEVILNNYNIVYNGNNKNKRQKQETKKLPSLEILQSKSWPIVQFENGQRLMMFPDKWDIKPENRVLATRTQVPLMLASAVTIHKVQGMTLDKVQCSLQNTFEFGQGYVAISRLRELNGLVLTSAVDPRMFKAHPQAVAYYQNLSKLQTVCAN